MNSRYLSVVSIKGFSHVVSIVSVALVSALPLTACEQPMGQDSGVTGDLGVVVGDTGVTTDSPTTQTDGGVTDTFIPRADTGVVNRCQNAAQCDDGVACTIDECNLGNAMCLHRQDLSRCECDPDCHTSQTGGMGGRPFNDMGRMGVDFDMASGGLIVRASPRMSDYLWVPNTGESTVSKWDATLEREVARYRVGLPEGECRGQCCYDSGCNQVSRVVVDGTGNAYAASRAFDMQGSVSKMAADRVDCVDRNMNGVIETSTGPMNVLPYGADECVIWTANVGDPNAVLRSITIDRGDEMFPEGYAWVGGCSNTGGLDGNAGLFQLNPRTGATIRHVDFPACAYGAVVTTDGTIWEHCLSEGIFSVDPVTGRAGPLLRAGEGAADSPGGSYGIAADGSGRVWLSRPGQDAVGYDPRMRQWTWANIGGRGGTGLGITVDANNHVWVSGPDTAFDWDANAFRAGGQIAAADIHEHNFMAVPGFDGVSAIGADRRGNIWMATSSPGPLVKYDPVMNVARGFDGPNQVYTYSDFTGSVRRLAIGTGSYSENYNTMCEPEYGQLLYTASTPMGTTLQFVMRTATTEALLGAATPVNLGVAPRDGSPIDVTARLLAAGVTPGQFARITVNFNPTNSPVQTPVLQSMSLQWRCPVNPG